MDVVRDAILIDELVELLADMLFETGNYDDALLQYRSVLNGSPGRLNALIGAANSASRIGNAVLKEQYGAVIRQQTQDGNAQRAGLNSIVN